MIDNGILNHKIKRKSMKKNLNDFKRLLLTACCTLVLSCGWATVNENP